MDFVENVGRRSQVRGDNGSFINVGIFSVNGFEKDALYRNLGNGKFFDVAYLEGCDRIEDARGLGFLDANGDGGVDVVLNNYLMPAKLLINHPPSEHHWMRLWLEGARPNPSAIGARVEAHHGAMVAHRQLSTTAGYLSGQSLYQHFGLGVDKFVDRLVIHWPSGRVEEIGDLPADAFYKVKEGEGKATLVFPRRENVIPSPAAAAAATPAATAATATAKTSE